MTNAEKYLKEGVDIKQFLKEVQDLFGKEVPLVDETINDWLHDTCKPTLTEDERVILRNINKKYRFISREEENLFVEDNQIDIECISPFNHLFQFIKERRRILY